MKLTNLKVCGIRGFNLEREINLDDGLTVIYGPNGQGKTSFVEAIENDRTPGPVSLVGTERSDVGVLLIDVQPFFWDFAFDGDETAQEPVMARLVHLLMLADWMELP